MSVLYSLISFVFLSMIINYFLAKLQKGATLIEIDLIHYSILYVSNFKLFTLLYGLTVTAIEFGNFVLNVLGLNLKV